MDDGWHAIAIIRDITQRTKTMEEMQRLIAVVEQGKDAIIIADAHNMVQYVNPAFSEITGYEESEIIGNSWSNVKHIDDFNVYQEDIFNQLNQNLHWKKRRKAARKDGTIYNEETLISPVLDEKTSVLKYIVITRRDITKEMNLEEQLQQSQKLESIGQLAAGIAHEINTPTQYVSDNIQFISDSHGQLMDLIDEYSKTELSAADLEKLDAFKTRIDFEFLKEEIPAAIDQSIGGIERVSNIVKAIKEFSHPGEKKMKLVDINHSIETTITIARNEWKYVADVTTDFQKDLPMVTCLPGEINQVVLNLIINASHAISDTLKTRKREKGNIHIQTLHQGEFIQIRVRDDGSGIPTEVQPRVFDPFFTTKSVGNGTGQGLSLAHMTVVNNHAGALYFKTEIDKGTTFFVELPIEGKNEVAPDE
jgi:PAS domain S-box-containing protein